MPESRKYPRPPITEAVLELRFEGALSAREMERVRDRFKSKYSTIEQVQMVEFEIGARGASTTKMAIDGFKMTDENAVDVLMLKSISLGTIRLAPYETWENLRDKAAENWNLFERVLNTRKRVTRIGARFLNRIDIPTDLFESKPVDQFFRTYVTLGEDISEKVGSFSYQMLAIHRTTGAKLLIQSAILPQPALLDHTSVTLDTDAYWDSDIPQRIEEMWRMADKLREAKNDVFENSITDAVRGLFQ